MEIKYNGLSDKRTDKEKAQDFLWNEVNVSGTTTLEERAPISYTPRTQNGSSSCVAQSVAKMLEVFDFRHDSTATVYSATPIYQNRKNKPEPGMIGIDALKLAVKGNVYLEKDVPSQNINDTQIDTAVIDESKKRKERPTNYIVLPNDFDLVIQQIRSTGCVMIWNSSDYHEWCKKVPTGNSDNNSVRHSVVAVDAILFENKEYIIIEDSWGTFEDNSNIPLKENQRAITREYFNKHIFFCATFDSFVFDGGQKPTYNFYTTMKFGDNHPMVNQLQKMLVHEQFFPSNKTTTNYFGVITARALKAWQLKHGIEDFKDEKDMTKIRFGEKSKKVANTLYAPK